MPMTKIKVNSERIRKQQEELKYFIKVCYSELKKRLSADEIAAIIEAYAKRCTSPANSPADDFENATDSETTDFCTDADKDRPCRAKDPAKCPVHGNAGNNSENAAKNKEKKPVDKPENKNKIKLTGKQKIIAEAEKKAKTEPPNYFELSGRSSSFPQNWKATKFSHGSTSKDHDKRHGKDVGAKDEADYIAKAKEFIHSPLGENGEAFIGTDEKIYKYDYKTKHLAIAYKDGTIGTYWNIGADKGLKGADKWWEDKKTSYKEN